MKRGGEERRGNSRGGEEKERRRGGEEMTRRERTRVDEEESFEVRIIEEQNADRVGLDGSPHSAPRAVERRLLEEGWESR